MPGLCAKFLYLQSSASGFVGEAAQAAGNTAILVLDPSVTDLTTCAYVVETGSGLSQLLNLSAADGATYSAGIIGCWVVAYFLRTVFSVIKGSIQNEVD